MQFQIESDATKHIEKYIIFNGKMKDPYQSERYKRKDEETSSKIQEFADMKKKKQENEWLKVFDDRTLEYLCSDIKMLDFEKVDLSNSQVTDQGIEALAKSKYVSNIKELDLSRNTYNIQDVSLRYIRDSINLQNIQKILLKDCTISDFGIMYLFQPFYQQVELYTKENLKSAFTKSRLKRTIAEQKASTLSMNQKTQYSNSHQITQFSDSITQYTDYRTQHLRFQNLVILSLQGNNQFTDQGLECISCSVNIRLKYLDLSFTKISDYGLIKYFESPNCMELEYLNISYQNIGEPSIKSYALSPYCQKLVTLLCHSCPLNKIAIDYLTKSENTKTVEELDIGSDDQSIQLSDDSIVSLIRAIYLGNLKIFNLSGHQFTQRNLEQFLSSALMKNIRELSLCNNKNINDGFCFKLSELIKDNKIDQLKKIKLIKTNISHRGVEVLQDLKILDITHSIREMPRIMDINRWSQLGIKLFVCEKCATEDQEMLTKCFMCKEYSIVTPEYPAKLCLSCGEKYQNKNCFTCGRFEAGKYPLYKCHRCALGEKQFQCIHCKLKIY